MPDQATNVRKGEELDTKRLREFLGSQIPAFEGNLSILQFPGGFSNLTYLIKWGEKEFVLRRPPFGSKVKSAHDMGREFHILSKLSKVWDKAPKPILFCENEKVIGAPFYMMERVKGYILRAKMPEGQRTSKDAMAAAAEALVDTLVELHNIQYEEIGLSDFGKPEGYVERQISGWTKRYFNAKTDEVPQMEKAAAWLAGHLPAESKPSLIHNDFKYDNLVFQSLITSHQSPSFHHSSLVKAVLDWEMATTGDPLMDLGTTLGYWINPDDPPFLKLLQLGPTTLPGNPTRSQVLELYVSKSGREAGNPVFYYVYGLFKIAVIVQQIYYRYKKGLTQDPRFAGLIEAVKGCGQAAMLAIEKRRIDDW